MGKGSIVSGGAGGAYVVRKKYYRDRYERMVGELQKKASSFAEILASFENMLSERNSELLSLQADYEYWSSLPEIDQSKLNDLLRQIEDKKKDVARATQAVALTKLEKASCEARIRYLNINMPEDLNIDTWCVDYTEDLSGEVGTIEVAGDKYVTLIQPGYEGNAAYSAARDGQVAASAGLTAPGVFYNLAMKPGWQKWKPTYRTGHILYLSGDNAEVILDAHFGGITPKSVNQDLFVQAIIEYMNCNGVAFAVGDHVVVKFEGQSWSNAKVIGFAHDPKPCNIACTAVTEAMLSTDIASLLEFSHSEQLLNGWSYPAPYKTGTDFAISGDASELTITADLQMQLTLQGGNFGYGYTSEYVLTMPESGGYVPGWYHFELAWEIPTPGMDTSFDRVEGAGGVNISIAAKQFFYDEGMQSEGLTGWAGASTSQLSWTFIPEPEPGSWEIDILTENQDTGSGASGTYTACIYLDGNEQEVFQMRFGATMAVGTAGGNNGDPPLLLNYTIASAKFKVNSVTLKKIDRSVDPNDSVGTVYEDSSEAVPEWP